MSTFNQVKKITYSSNPRDVVALSEFIVMSDDNAKSKYLILKFQNNVAQMLGEFAFEITEYDAKNNLIEKLTLNQQNVNAEASKEFVPNAKLKVNYDTDRITYKLISAKFERVIWHDGEFTKIPFNIDEFVKREDRVIEEPWEKEKLIAAQQKIDKLEAKKYYKDNKKRLKGKELEVKSIRKQNISKKPTVITIILSILFVASIIGVLIYYNFRTTRFSNGDFDYKILNSNNEVSVERYFGKGSDAVIPKTFTILTNTYKVTAVEPNAFKDSKVNSVEFSANIKIENNAFLNCKSLTEVKGNEYVTFIGNDAFRGCSSLTSVVFDNATEVGQKAFADCSSLTSASFAKATMMSTSLYHDDALTKLAIYDTMQDNLSSLFIAEEGEVLPKLIELSIHKAKIPANFFKEMTTIKKVTFENPLTKFDYEALKGTNVTGYYIYENIEVLNGVIISLKDNTTELSIPNTVVDLRTSLENINDKLNSITSLKIDCPNIDKENPISKDQLAGFRNVTKFGISSKTPKNNDILKGLNSLNTLVIDSSDSFITDNIEIPYSVVNLEVVGSGTLSKALFSRFSSVTSLKVDNTVTNCVDGALANLTSLKNLVMPYYPNITINNLEVSQGIKTIEFTKTYAGSIASNFVSNYSMLESLTLPREVNRILDDFAKNCPKLVTLNLPNNLNYIGNNFINNCQSLTEITLPSSISAIMDNFIANCSNLSSVRFTSTSNVSIGDNAFSNLAKLREIVLPKYVTEIGKYYISNCPLIDEVNISNNVTKLGVPFIGGGNNVSVLHLPFIGSKGNEESYEYFNESYAKTVELYINKGFSVYGGYELFQEENNTLNTLKINGVLSGNTDSFLANLKALKNVYLDLNTTVRLGKIVGVDTLKTVIVKFSGGIQDMFSNLYIEDLVIKGGMLTNATFVGLLSVKDLYISNNASLTTVEFDEYKDAIDDIYFEGLNPKVISKITVYENVGYDIFKLNHQDVNKLEK